MQFGVVVGLFGPVAIHRGERSQLYYERITPNEEELSHNET